MSREVAQARHKKRKRYTALIGMNELPSWTVTVVDDAISVGFLDEKHREYLSYSFREVQPGRVFLHGATLLEFADDSAVRSTCVLRFNENGQINITQRCSLTGDTKLSTCTASVEENWDTYPEFADYSALCRVERVKVRPQNLP